MDNSDGSHNDEGEPVVKRVRGSTKMGALVERHEQQQERLHVDFDANMNPIGAEEDKFISYVGYLARSKVRIVYLTWKLVPSKMKDLIWQQILVYNFWYIYICIFSHIAWNVIILLFTLQQTYDVPDNKVMKKHLMGAIRIR